MTKGVPASGGRATRPTAQAPAGLGDTASVPNARSALEAIGNYNAAVSERQAIVAFLLTRAARATDRWLETPAWRFMERARLRWSMAMCVETATALENRNHHEDQATWLTEIGGGYLRLASAIEAQSDATTQIGAAEGESAVGDSRDAQTIPSKDRNDG